MFLLSSDENLDVIICSSFLQLDHFYGDVNGYRSFKKVNRYFSQFAIYSSWHPDLLFFVCWFFSKFLLRYLVCGEIFQWCIVPWATFKLLWLNRYCFERIITHYFRLGLHSQVEYCCALLFLLTDTQNSRKRQFAMHMRTCIHSGNLNNLWLLYQTNIVRWGQLFLWIKFFLNLTKTKECSTCWSNDFWVEEKKTLAEEETQRLFCQLIRSCTWIHSTISSNSFSDS